MLLMLLILLALAREGVLSVNEVFFEILEAVAQPAGWTEDVEEKPKEDDRREESPLGGRLVSWPPRHAAWTGFFSGRLRAAWIDPPGHLQSSPRSRLVCPVALPGLPGQQGRMSMSTDRGASVGPRSRQNLPRGTKTRLLRGMSPEERARVQREFEERQREREPRSAASAGGPGEGGRGEGRTD